MYVVLGHIRFRSRGKSWEMCAGDSLVVDGGIDSEPLVLEPSKVLDLFASFRQDYAGGRLQVALSIRA